MSATPNGSGAEQRGTIADSRSGTLPLNASARATGYAYRPRMPPAHRTDPHLLAATATTTDGRTALPKPQAALDACSQR